MCKKDSWWEAAESLRELGPALSDDPEGWGQEEGGKQAQERGMCVHTRRFTFSTAKTNTAL